MRRADASRLRQPPPPTHPAINPQATGLNDALTLLQAHGAITLPGRPTDVTLRWLKRRRVLRAVAIGILVLGVVLIVIGGALRNEGVWSLGIPAGCLLTFLGAVWLGVVFLLRRLMNPRLFAEAHPVTITPQGITLRGIGPIPWSDVAAPRRTYVRVRNDIGGDCTVMPLTPQGRGRVNAQPGWFRNLVGPKPWLRVETPYLLLPGIEELTEDETLQLFQTAYERFAR